MGWGFVVRGSKPCHIQAVDPGGPAAAAGLKVKARVVYGSRVNVHFTGRYGVVSFLISVCNKYTHDCGSPVESVDWKWEHLLFNAGIESCVCRGCSDSIFCVYRNAYNQIKTA